jgi:hypothetical protein
MKRQWVRRAVILLAAVLAMTGCATTRRMEFGPLANRESLVTLVVSEDRGVIARECGGASAAARESCENFRPIVLDGGLIVRAVTLVRYTDTLPSAVAFEIDAHEMCHAIAALQPIDDPCHIGNGGVIQALR